MHNFEVNQPCSAGFILIHNVLHGPVGVGPRPIELGVPKLMRAAELGCRRCHHLSSERACHHVIPKAFPRHFVHANCVFAHGKGAKMVPVQHLKTVDFPTLPIVRFTPEADRYLGQTKEEIG